MEHHFKRENPPPPIIVGEHPFSRMTMLQRLPKIVQDVLVDHTGEYPADVVTALQGLHDELVDNQLVSPLNSQQGDNEAWYEAWQPYQDKRWLEIPWFFGEAFFYRRLLQASGYYGWPLVAFQQHPPATDSYTQVEAWQGVDPFLPRKMAELQTPTPWHIVRAALADSQTNDDAALRRLLHYGVWGNRADLSYTAVRQSTGAGVSVEHEQSNMVVDESATVVDYLHGVSQGQVVLVCDNAGTELLMDLLLVDYLLQWGWAEQVTMHVKAHPTFVSDTIKADIFHTLMALMEQPDPTMLALANRLQHYGDRLQVKHHLFWNSASFFWELPAELYNELAKAHLVIFKGDANYRRLIGDSLAWNSTLSLAEAAPYFPTSLVTLRTLKSPSIVGLAAGQAAALEAEDKAWRINGKRGIIQTVLK